MLDDISAVNNAVLHNRIIRSQHPELVIQEQQGELAGFTTTELTYPKFDHEDNGLRSLLEQQNRDIDQKLQQLIDSITEKSSSSSDDDDSVVQYEYFFPDDKHDSSQDENIHTQMSWTSTSYTAQNDENRASSDPTFIHPMDSQDWTTLQKDMEIKILRMKVETQQRELLNKDLEIALLTERLNDKDERMQRSKEDHNLIEASEDSSSLHGKKIHIELDYNLTDVSKNFDEKKLQAIVEDATTVARGKHSTSVVIVAEHVPLSSPNTPSPAPTNASQEGSPHFHSAGRDTTGSSVSSEIQIVPIDAPLDEASKLQDQDEPSDQDIHIEQKQSASPNIALQQNNNLNFHEQASQRSQGLFHQNVHGKIPASEPIKISMASSSNNKVDQNNASNALLDGFHVDPFILLSVPSMEEDDTATNSYDMCSSSAAYTEVVESTSIFGDDITTVEAERVSDSFGRVGRYTGVLLRSTDLPHGYGRIIYEESGLRYDGQWTHGQWNGYARVIYSNNDVYEGEFQFHKRHGRGKLHWSDGRVYEGEFDNDVHHGKGTHHWPNGSVYEGEFCQGKQEGEGTISFPDGTRYTGNFINNRYEGFGECQWADGHTYKGEWQDGKCHGQGVETKSDGRIRHDGKWIENEPIKE